jgi:hypothetical protein
MTLVAIDTVLTNVRQMVRKAPIITVRRAYTRAMREWCQQTQWLRVTVGGQTIISPDPVKIYTLGSDDNLDIMGIRAMSLTQTLNGGATQTFGLSPSDSSQWNPNLPVGVPRRYCYLPEGEFAVDPTPDAVYVLTLSVIVAPKESMLATAMIPAEPLVKYSNDIEAGALVYLQNMKGEPWFDPGAAGANAKAFAAAINNGKAEVQRAFNTGSQRVRAMSFGSVGMRY